MSSKPPTVYLEDIETRQVAQATETTDGDATPVESTVATAITTTTTTNTSVKRQRTLQDMFSGSQGSDISEPSAKKAKISVKGVAASSKGKASTSGAVQVIGLQPLNSIPFSLSAYLDSLNEESRKLLSLECDVMGKSWLKMLKDEIKKPYFLQLKQFLWQEGVQGADTNTKGLQIYPFPRDIYAWSNTPLGKVKVVILGQDPYHGPNQAHGYCFSVKVGVAIPPSLRNIYAELRAEYPDFVPPKHGNLTAWANDGVLMLNTCMTVRQGSAGSHFNKGWETFTEKVIDVIDKYGGATLPVIGGDNAGTGIGRGVVFLAWGAPALKRLSKVNKGKHLILSSPHPSPLSAHRGFLGNGHFKAANAWLEKKYGTEGQVNWCSLETPS